MDEDIAAGLAKAGLALAEKHVFICIGPDCCDARAGERLWEFVKRRVRDSGLHAMRTKAGCFRICSGGPWLCVYPEGVWYGAVDEVRFERILSEHLLGGVPVAEWITVQNALGSRREPGQCSLQSPEAAGELRAREVGGADGPPDA